MPNCLEILNQFPELLTHVSGDLQIGPLEPTSSIDFPQKNSVLFIADSNKLSQAILSEASLLIVAEKLEPEASKLSFQNKAIFCSKNLHASMALVNQKYFYS